MNVAKFYHVRFLPKLSFDPDTSIYSVNGNPIKTISQHKDLGTIFTADLNWTEHYKTITARAYQTLGIIRRTFRINCVEAKKQLYIALICSQLLYCSQLWRPQLIKDITMLEHVQRCATKYILNDYTSSYKSRLKQLQMLPLMYIYELDDLMFFIKSLQFPTANFNISQHISFTCSNTRSRDYQKLLHPRTTFALHHHFYFNRIARLWNYLPVTLPAHIIKQKLKSLSMGTFHQSFSL